MTENEEACVFFKKTKRKGIRTKKEEKSSSDDDEVKIFKKSKKQDTNPLVQKTFSVCKKSNEHESDSDDAAVKSYKASRSSDFSGPKDQGATATQELHPDKETDAQALFEKSMAVNKTDSSSDGLYKGINNYKMYMEKKDTARGNASSGYNRLGPMRAPAHLRATVRWDYQPDICKDYKETGFCSFGDSCKFLHDRSDYKFGWEIDKEIEEGTYGEDGEDDRYVIKQNMADEQLPLECMLCRGEFRDPVVTVCKHYFCSACAIKRYKKSARCYACNEDTKGRFKNVPDLLKKIREQEDKRKPCHSDHSDEDEQQECDRGDRKIVGRLIDNEEEVNAPLAGGSDSGEDLSDDDLGYKAPAFPTLTRLGGAKAETLQDCNTSEEEDDSD